MNEVSKGIKILNEEEKHKVLQAQPQSEFEEQQILQKPEDRTSSKTINNIKNDIQSKKDDGEMSNIENTYRTIFENYAIAITLVDEKERIVSWNKYTEELLALDETDLFMKPVSMLYPPDEWQRIRKENVRQKGIKYRMETKMIRKDKVSFDVEISICVLKSEKGKTVGSVGIIRDITKQKEMERALEKSEKKFKQLYEKAPVPYHTLSPSGIITDVNEIWCQLLGYSKDEVIGRSIFDFIHETEREIAKASFEKKLQSKIMYSQANERTYITKGGEKQIFVIRDFFSFDEHNDVTNVYTIMDDVTELNEVKEELQKTGLIRESVQRLQTIIEKIEDGITLSDTKGNFELFNSKMQEITGYTIEEANRCGDFTTLLYPDFQEQKKALDNINETIKKGVSRNIETTIQTKDGTKKTLLVSTSIINLGGHDMFLSVYHDITERIKMQQMLNESTVMYETLVNASPEAISVFDMEGRFIYASPQTLKLHGYERKEDLLGHSAFELIAPEDHTSAMNILQQITKTPILQDLQYTAVRKDGTRFILEGSAVVIKDPYGNPKSFISVTRDITERKKMEEAIKESEEKFRIMSTAAVDAVIMMDSQGCISFWNESAKRIFGYSTEEISGKNLHMVLAPNRYHDAHKKGFIHFQKTGEGPALNKTIELVGVRKDGTEFPLELSVAPVQVRGQWHAVGIIRDIIGRKKIEDDLKKKIDELERYKKVTIGRELQMIELKKQIQELEAKLNNTK